MPGLCRIPTSKQRIAAKYLALSGLMDERMSRQWAAAEAAASGWGGVHAVSEATGMAPHTIRKGSAELAERAANPGTPLPPRIRRPGGGRRCGTEWDPELTTALELWVDPATRGDPMSPWRWTCKSTTRLAEELTRQGHLVSPSRGLTIIGTGTRDKAQPAARLSLTTSVTCLNLDLKPHEPFL